MTTFDVRCGDALTLLKQMPDESAQCCITSPPYWGLRDYGMDGQLGMERTPEEYIGRLCAVFSEVRRVLSGDGTLWLNLGDSYAAGGNGGGGNFMKMRSPGAWADREFKKCWRSAPQGTKPKDLVGIPWMAAFALRADGWYLRSDIIWSKPNPMPESVTDRPTKSHEYLFLLSKRARYYYDADAIKEPGVYAGPNGSQKSPYAQGFARRTKEEELSRQDKQRGHGRRHAGFNDRWDAMEKAEQCGLMRNKRSVWTVSTKPFPDAHFATFPEALIEPCILAGCPKAGTVLDIFCGSGTTGVVACGHGRNFIGFELNPTYVEMARRRIGAITPLFSMEANIA